MIFLVVIFGITGQSCNQKPKNKLSRSKPRLVDTSYLYLLEGKPIGIFRVECNDCEFSYTVNQNKKVIQIREGNEDRFIFPKQKSLVNTQLTSHQDQMVRVLAINPNGIVISNVLDSFKRDETRLKTYNMQYEELKETKRITIQSKD